MHISNLFKIAVRAIGANKLRSFLTMLGIIIGVGSVIAMIAIGQGSKQSIQKNMATKKKCFANTMMKQQGSPSFNGNAEAKKLQSASSRHKAMLTRDV